MSSKKNGSSDTRPSTSINAKAAKLALACTGGLPTHYSGHVLVEDERIIATDCQRLVIVAAASAGGLFDRGEAVAMVPAEALKDAARDAERVLVNDVRLATLNEKGKSTRFVPFEGRDPEHETFPDWRSLKPPRRGLSVAFNPTLLGSALVALGKAGCEVAELRLGKQDEPILVTGEIDDEQQVELLVQPNVAGVSGILPGLVLPDVVPPTDAADPAASPAVMGAMAGLADSVARKDSGIDSMTLSAGGRSVTIDKEGARNIQRSVKRALGRGLPPKAGAAKGGAA